MVDTEVLSPSKYLSPKKYRGEASQNIPEATVEFYRAEFYKVLDTLDMQFSERFIQADLQKLGKLENVVLTGVMDEIIDQHPNLRKENLKVQLAMFRMKNVSMSSNEAAHILKAMPLEMSGLFSQVRLLLVSLFSSSGDKL